MSTPFQNRLVGTIIVAAAVIIFLPDILNGEKRDQHDSFEKIPTPPKSNNVVAIKKFPTKKLTRIAKEPITDDIALDEQFDKEKPVASSTSTIINTTASTTKSASTTKKPSITAKNDKKSTQQKQKAESPKQVKKQTTKKIVKQTSAISSKYAWVIQLGSFRERHNVDSLIQKLQKNGYTAFSRPIKTRHGNLIKVFVGPELSKAALERKLIKLKHLTNTQGKISRYKPAG